MKFFKRYEIIFYIIIVLVFYIIISFFAKKDKSSLLKNIKFTVAIIESDFHYKRTSGGAGYDFIYYVNNIPYHRTVSRGNYKTYGKYLIAYDSLKPRNYEIFNHIEITDSMYSSPDNGWKIDKIPFKVNTKELLEYIKQ